MYQAIELQVFDVAHHSEIHNKNLPAQPGQDYCNSYEWYHLTLGCESSSKDIPDSVF